MTKLRSVTQLPTATQREPETLEDAVRMALGDMSQWAHGADRANAQLALMMARQIDGAEQRHQEYAALSGDDKIALSHVAKWCEAAATLDLLGPKLHAILRDLGATPAGRKGISMGEQKSGRLAALRRSAT